MKRTIGEKFKTPDGVELEVCKKHDLCYGCYFYEHQDRVECSTEPLLGDCTGLIFKEVE